MLPRIPRNMLISYLRYWGEMLTSLSSQVIQEVAAARSILIQCGGVQVDGYEFSDFLELETTFWKARQILAHSLSQTRPIVKLIRSVSHLRRYPLGTLIDMYHAYQASDPVTGSSPCPGWLQSPMLPTSR